MATAAQIQGIYRRVMRVELNSYIANSVADAINSGQTTLANYISGLISQTSPSTRPALLVSNYCQGAIRESAGVDSQAAFCKQQYDYYVMIGSKDADLGPYEALGKAYWEVPAFQTKIQGLTVAQIINDAYQAALGTAPSTEVVTHFTAQHDYFYGLYVNAGTPIGNASLQAKGAMVGQILGYGARSSTAFNNKATAWLNAAANGTETYSVPL